MKVTSRFWPLDYDQEVAIYDNPSWDLPGRKPPRTKRPGKHRSTPAKSAP
jgi:hypothetical protein